MQKSKKDAGLATRAALYIRVSTDEQALHGLSLEAQRAALEKYAAENGYKVIDTYIDAGKTARKALSQRVELKRLLEDVENDKIDLILFTKLDRWFRNIKDYYKVQEILESHSTNWKTIFENYDTTTANGRLCINIMLSIAQDEADRCSERIKAVFANKRKNGEATSPMLPIGYKLADSRIEIDEAKAPIAVELFEHYYMHHSQRKAQLHIINTFGEHLHHATIKNMLTNPLYKGEYYGYKNFCKPLVNAAVFDEIQEIIKSKNVKRTATGYEFIFSGLLICSECGKHMSGNAQMRTYSGGRRDFYTCYRCNTYYSSRRCSHSRCIGERTLEKFLLDNICGEINDYIMDFEINEKKKKKPKANKLEISHKLDRLKDLYINDLIDLDTYKNDYSQLTAQLKAAEESGQKRTRRS